MKTKLTLLTLLFVSLAAVPARSQVSSGTAVAPPNNHDSSDYPSPSPTLHPHDPTPPPSPGPRVRPSVGQIIFQTPTPNPSVTAVHPDVYDASLKPTSTVLPAVSPYPTVPFEPTVPPRNPTLSTERPANIASETVNPTRPPVGWHDAQPPRGMTPIPVGSSPPTPTPTSRHVGGVLQLNPPNTPPPGPTRSGISDVAPEPTTAGRQSQVRGNVSWQTPTPTWPPPPTPAPGGTASFLRPPSPSPAPTRHAIKHLPPPHSALRQAEPDNSGNVRPAPGTAGKLAPGGAVPVATPYYPVDPAINPHIGNAEPAPSEAAKSTPNSTLTTSGIHMGPPRKKLPPPVIKARQAPPRRNTGVKLPTPYPEWPVPPKDPTTSPLRQSGPGGNSGEPGNHPRGRRQLLRQPQYSPTPGPSVHPTRPPRNPTSSPL